MKVNQKLHQAKLSKWVTLLQDQASSGLSVKEWCAQNDVTIHAYYYWKRIAKEAYINSIIPEIVPLPVTQTQELPSCSSDQPLPELRNSHDSRNVNETPVLSPSPLSVSIGDVRIVYIAFQKGTQTAPHGGTVPPQAGMETAGKGNL